MNVFHSRNRRRAFSLLELMIAFTVFSLLMLGFYRIMQSSGSRLAFSGHTLLGNRVASKVMSDLQEDSRINVAFLEFLQNASDLTSKDRVVNGQSAFFRHAHDQSPPWGAMDPGVDGGIGPSDGDLYKQLDSYQIRVGAARPKDTTGPARHLAEVQVTVDWTEKGGKTRSYVLNSWVPSPAGPIPYEKVALVDETTLQEDIRRLFFPNMPLMTFDEAVTARNCNRDLLLQLGRVSIATRNLFAAVASADLELKTLRQRRTALLAAPSYELVATQWKMARQCEMIAGMLFMGLKELDPVMKTIGSTFQEEKLGNLEYSRITLGFRNFAAGVEGIPVWVKQAGKEFSWMLGNSLARFRPLRMEEHARLKALEAFRLLSLLDPSSVGEYETFVRQETARCTGRNPYWERSLARESSFPQNPGALKSTFGNLASLIGDFETILQPDQRLAEKIARQDYP